MGDHSEIVAGKPAEGTQLIHASQTAPHTTFSAPESPFLLFNVTDQEREWGVGLCMRSKLKYLLFRFMWETYFCVHFQSRYGRLKTLQSFWYALYFGKISYYRATQYAVFSCHLIPLRFQYCPQNLEHRTELGAKIKDVRGNSDKGY
jgi:hypothetical protein